MGPASVLLAAAEIVAADRDRGDAGAARRSLSAATYVDKETRTGLIERVNVELEPRCRSGDEVLRGGLKARFGRTILSRQPMKRSGASVVEVEVEDGRLADAWRIC